MSKKCKFFKRLNIVMLLLITLISSIPFTRVKADDLKKASEVGLPDATSSNFVAKGYDQFKYKDAFPGYPSKSVSSSGCGYCTVCGIHTTITGKKVNPSKVAAKYIKYYSNNAGCQHTVIKSILTDWGYTVKPLGRSKSELVKYLKKGYMVAMISSSVFTNNGHFLYVYGYDTRTSYTTEKTMGKDKSGREETACARVFTSSLAYQNKQWFSIDTIIRGSRNYADAGGPFWAVTAYDGKVAQQTGSDKEDDSKDSDTKVASSGDGWIQFGGEVMDEEYFISSDNDWGYNLVSMAKSENLTVNEQTQVARWSENIKNNSRGVIGFFRTLTAFLGILITIYSLLLYMCYWLDRSNNIVDVSTLRILTFNQLQISPDDNSTFNPNQQGTKYVIHKDIIFVTVIGCTMGVLVMTGQIYNIVGAFWHWTNSLIK